MNVPTMARKEWIFLEDIHDENSITLAILLVKMLKELFVCSLALEGGIISWLS